MSYGQSMGAMKLESLTALRINRSVRLTRTQNPAQAELFRVSMCHHLRKSLCVTWSCS